MKKIFLFLTLAAFILIPIKGFAKDISITFRNESPVTVLSQLKKETGYDFAYRKDLIDGIKKKVTASFHNAGINEILEQVLVAELGLSYEVADKTVFIKKGVPTAKSTVTLTGTVRDENGEPVVGASVVLKNSRQGTSTNLAGQFALENINSNGYVTISYVGYKPTTVFIGGKKTLNVMLRPDLKNLSEVVVVGYGTTKLKDLTGSVSSIGEKVLSQLNVPTSAQMLQNLAAGVQVSSGTGVPGETVRVRVRGATSFSGSNEPLFVIDGVPVTGADALNDIPPSDIKSMDVLKDASAAAIYGSRAANGVVLVTTKRGESGSRPKLSFNYNITTDEQINNFRILYGDEWRETVKRFARETLVFDPSNDYASEILKEGSEVLGSANTNWFNLIKQSAVRHNASMNMSGGGKNSNYLISASLMDQKGMVIGDRLNRYSARMSAEASILPILKVGMNANMTYSEGTSAQTSLFAAQGCRPDLSPYYENGSYDLSISNNPVAQLAKDNSSDNSFIMGTLYGEVEILKSLKFRTSLSATLGHSDSEYFTPKSLSTRRENYGGESHSRRSKTLWDNTLTYTNSFNEIHVLDAMVGISWEKYISKSMSLSGQTYPDDEIFTNIGSAATITNWSSGYSATGLFSSFTRLNYRLLDRYLFTFTCRYDGSSMFGSNNRYGLFPSGAVAWRINNEEFMRDISYINDLKLRGSVGRTGVQNLGTYANRDIYSSGSYNGSNTIFHSQVGNRDIRWETSTQYDLGLDFGFYNNRIKGSLSAYKKLTDDLIWSFSFPPSATTGSMPRNIGAVRNSGIELNVTGTIIDTPDWGLDLTLNMAHNRNKVTKLVPEGRAQSAMSEVVQGSGNQVLVEGYPMGAFFGYKHNGIIKSQGRIDELNAYAKSKGQNYYYGNGLKPGHLELLDLNEDGKVDNNDRTVIGSPEADLYGGMIANLRYKDFSLFCNFGYQIGGKKLYSKALQNLPGQLCGLIDYGLNRRWSADNPDGDLPALYIGDGVPVLTDHELFDASFFRLQEVRLTYLIPLRSKVHCSLFASASNLFTITRYPGTDVATVNNYSSYGGNYETSSYPGIRSFSAGMQLNF